MKKISLLTLKENQKAKVVECSGGQSLQDRLLSMGIYPGKEIIKLSHFALKGPVTIKVGRSVIALGHMMAGRIMVETE
jgi:ferrous iron transport protein A